MSDDKVNTSNSMKPEDVAEGILINTIKRINPEDALVAIFINTINRKFEGDEMYKMGVLANIKMAIGEERYNHYMELYLVKQKT